jgi:hypothetical protein
MAEDDMEISSEHGHDVGDQDIDIDIDFTASHADEDDILEDVMFNEGLEDDPILQPSLAVVHDEVMVDEDNHPYQMDDTDLLHERITASNDDSGSFDGDNLGHTEGYTTGSNLEAEDAGFQDTAVFDHLSETGEETSEMNTDLIGAENPEPDLHDQDDADPADEVPPAQFQDNSETPTPHNQIAPDVIETDEPRSLVSSHKSGGNTPEHIANDAGTEEEDQIPSTDSNFATTLQTLDSPIIPIAVPHFVVSWDGKDYPLFSTSESDDPDTFFLSDTSMLDKPLFEFLEAIRKVIQGDLGDEDELVLSIDDLCLETSEVCAPLAGTKNLQLTRPEQTSTAVKTVSLAQIVALRQQLLHNEVGNDGDNKRDESCDQFFISITVKKNFSKRLSNLIAGAAGGKCLSDFWEEHSPSLINLGEATERLYNHESAAETSSSENAIEGDAYENDDEREEFEDAESRSQNEDSTSNHQLLLLSPTRDAAELEPTKVTSGSGEDLDKIPAKIPPGLGVFKAAEVLAGEIDEDGDIIDYSDDEVEFGDEQNPTPHPEIATSEDKGISANFIPTLCILPQSCFCPACSEILLADYDQINSNLLRRSLSPESVKEKVTKPEPHTLEIETEEVHEDHQDVVGVEVINDSYYAGDSSFDVETQDNSEQQDLVYDKTTDHAPMGQEGDSAAYNGEFGDDRAPDEGNDDYEDANEVEEYTHLISETDTLGLKLGFNAEIHPEVFSPPQNGGETTSIKTAELAGVIMTGASKHTAHCALGSLASTDTADSSVTLSVDEIQYEEGQDLEANNDSTEPDMELSNRNAIVNDPKHQDEIDYEDEEEEEDEDGKIEVNHDVHSPPELLELSPSNGKRSIAEVDFDDVLETRGSSRFYPRVARIRLV